MSVLKIGWAEVDITPDRKVALDGQFAERISQYVEKPITMTAMAIDSGDDHAIMCCVDLLMMKRQVVAEVRERLADNDLGIDPNKIMFSAIHTHTGPMVANGKTVTSVTSGFRNLIEPYIPEGKKYVESAPISQDTDIMTPLEYFEKLVEWSVELVVKAWNNRKPGSFTNAFGRAAVGMCRRAVFSDGSAQMWGDTYQAVFQELEGGNDSGIELMYVYGEDQKLTGIVINLCCPAQCVQHRHFVSPDFWGEVRVLLRQYFGQELFILCQCSSAGDQCPVDLVRWVDPESDLNDPNLSRNNVPKRKADPSMFDLAGMRKVGRRIAREVIDVYEEGLDAPQVDVEFKHVAKTYPLPLRRVTLEDAEKARKAIRDYMNEKEGDITYNDTAMLQVHMGTINRLKQQNEKDIHDAEVHIIRMGSVVFATNPFELFLDYGNQIKARSKAEQTFLVQLTNSWDGYLPTAKAERGGHYSAFVSSGLVGHAGGEQLVRQTLQDINKLF